MKIGNVTLDNNVMVAPMAGVTDLAYRTILMETGVGLLFTEMVSAKALYYKDKKTQELMRLTKGVPTAIQIFGREPDIMAYGAKCAQDAGAAMVDINMGCPVPKVAGNGEGSSLMKEPTLVGKIVDAVCNAVNVPVTVKIRSGWDSNSINALHIAKISQDAGASAITVHGRTREQMYSGKANWDIIGTVKNSLSIPVIGNGDILTPQDAKAMFLLTNCDCIMLARGVMSNPWLVAATVEYLKSGTLIANPTTFERLEMAKRHTRLLMETKGDSRGIKEARGHLTRYIKGMKNAQRVKNKLSYVSSYEEVEEILCEIEGEQN